MAHGKRSMPPPARRAACQQAPRAPAPLTHALQVISLPSASELAAGTPRAAAARPYGCPVDVWAVGVLLCELLTGHAPFQDRRPELAALKAQAGTRAPLPPGTSVECAAFVDAALTLAADARPPAAALLRHPWVQRCCGGGAATAAASSAMARAQAACTPAAPMPAAPAPAALSALRSEALAPALVCMTPVALPTPPAPLAPAPPPAGGRASPGSDTEKGMSPTAGCGVPGAGLAEAGTPAAAAQAVAADPAAERAAAALSVLPLGERMCFSGAGSLDGASSHFSDEDSSYEGAYRCAGTPELPSPRSVVASAASSRAGSVRDSSEEPAALASVKDSHEFSQRCAGALASDKGPRPGGGGCRADGDCRDRPVPSCTPAAAAASVPAANVAQAAGAERAGAVSAPANAAHRPCPGAGPPGVANAAASPRPDGRHMGFLSDMGAWQRPPCAPGAPAAGGARGGLCGRAFAAVPESRAPSPRTSAGLGPPNQALPAVALPTSQSAPLPGARPCAAAANKASAQGHAPPPPPRAGGAGDAPGAGSESAGSSNSAALACIVFEPPDDAPQAATAKGLDATPREAPAPSVSAQARRGASWWLFGCFARAATTTPCSEGAAP